MSLTWRGFSAADFADEFDRSATVTRRESKKVLREGAKQIIKSSQTMAPVDDGELEEAHHLQTIRLNRDDMELEIEIGGNVNGVGVDEYAMVMHEGSYNLGPLSEIKDAGNPPSHRVGNKFLDRAVDLHEDEIADKLLDTLPGDR